ncbi:hypothetical protein [Ralstonia psammae]|uniref:hypothetical protein n=1 Tax=Ralstonia psammae TaxID=3058598 RepID=UPI00292F668D|nr:hypothetical protein [Ralstonia sp. LMG 19083]
MAHLRTAIVERRDERDRSSGRDATHAALEKRFLPRFFAAQHLRCYHATTLEAGLGCAKSMIYWEIPWKV